MSHILVTDKYSGRQVQFDTIVAAADFTGIDRRVIAKALADPFHWIHQVGPRKNKDGTYSMKKKSCAFDFEKIDETYSVELWPVDEFHSPQKFSSMYSASKFLGVSRRHLYRLRTKATLGEAYSVPVKDKEGYEWYIVFNEPAHKVPDNFKHHN